jgi:hypothetical protein
MVSCECVNNSNGAKSLILQPFAEHRARAIFFLKLAIFDGLVATAVRRSSIISCRSSKVPFLNVNNHCSIFRYFDFNDDSCRLTVNYAVRNKQHLVVRPEQ